MYNDKSRLNETQLRTMASLYEFNHKRRITSLYKEVEVIQAYIKKIQPLFEDNYVVTITKDYQLNDSPLVVGCSYVTEDEVEVNINNYRPHQIKNTFKVTLSPHGKGEEKKDKWGNDLSINHYYSIGWSTKVLNAEQDTKDLQVLKNLLSYCSVNDNYHNNNGIQKLTAGMNQRVSIDLRLNNTKEILTDKGFLYSEIEELTDDQLNILYRLNDCGDYVSSPHIIIRIAEKDDIRRALVASISSAAYNYRYRKLEVGSEEFYANLRKHLALKNLEFKANTVDYNYIDLGRLYLHQDDYDNRHHNTLYLDFNDFDIDTMLKCKKAVNWNQQIDAYINHVGAANSILIKTSELEEALFPVLIAQEKQKKEEELNTSIKKNLKTRLKDKSKLVFNDMVFEDKILTYENQIIKVENMKHGTVDVDEDIIGAWLRNKINGYRSTGLADVNFNHVLEAVAQYLQSMVKSRTASFDITVGTITAKVAKTNKTSDSGKTIGRLTINDIRVNISELGEVIETMICYDSDDTFNAFLKSITSCSIAIHKLIATGISVNYYDNFFNQHINYTFHLYRTKGKNYVKGLKNAKYRIRNINSFKSKLRQSYSLQDMTSVFSDEKIVDIPADKIIDLMKEGIKTYKEALKRSEKLLQSTVKMLKAKEVQINTTYNGTINAYEVKGKKQTYYVDREGNHEVYGEDKSHICIVDKGHRVVGQDILVARMLTVANDSRVAHKVTTL